jgi:hypothetical protein
MKNIIAVVSNGPVCGVTGIGLAGFVGVIGFVGSNVAALSALQIYCISIPTIAPFASRGLSLNN